MGAAGLWAGGVLTQEHWRNRCPEPPGVSPGALQLLSQMHRVARELAWTWERVHGDSKTISIPTRDSKFKPFVKGGMGGIKLKTYQQDQVHAEG